MSVVDTLLRNGTLVTCNGTDDVVVGDLLIRGRNIVAIGKNAGKMAASGGRMVRVVDATDCAVIPGFVQAHVHLCQVLFRGMADDLPLLEWLKRRIWPLEASHDAASLRTSAELGLVEMMKAGTTAILDMGTVHHHDEVFDACERSGIRALSGKTMMDKGEGVPRGLRETTKESLRESERLCTTWSGRGDGRLGYAFAPRFILSCSEALVRGASDRAREHGAFLHTHAAEHPDERKAVRRILGAEDVAVLERWGVSGERAVLAHGVQLTDGEAKRVARLGTRVTHCPSANLKLGSGIARVAELRALGVAMALGADGAPCNNNLDPWVELRHAALLAKVRTSVTSLPAKEAFRLATIDGAVALGMGDVTGSLEAGKRADLAVVRLDGAHVEPGGDVFSKLVYACTSRDVRHVFVDGTQVVAFGEHRMLDESAILARARDEGPKVARRARLR
ncbi:MAG: 5'-deoxyadenosine deaminase [Polyangiaceae bacterium]